MIGILREEFDEKWPRLEQAVEKAVREAVENEAANAQPAPRAVEAVLEDVVTTLRDLPQDIKVINIAASLRSPELLDARRDEIYEEVSGLLGRHKITLFTLGIHERGAEPIQLHISAHHEYNQHQLAMVAREIESIPKYDATWVPTRTFDNTTLAASKAPPSGIGHG